LAVSWLVLAFGRSVGHRRVGRRSWPGARCFPGFSRRRCCRCLKLLVDLADALPGGCHLGGLRERLSEAGRGVIDLSTGVLDVGEGCGFAGFEPTEAVLKSANETDRLKFSQVGGGQGDIGTRCAVEGQPEMYFAESPPDGHCEREAAEFSGRQGSLAGAELVRGGLERDSGVFGGVQLRLEAFLGPQ
jgi:hypothetical protein